MSGAVIGKLEDFLGKTIMDTRRCQLDWERSSMIEYDYVPDRSYVPKEPGETVPLDKCRDLASHIRNWQGIEPRFKYFMDGSRRTFRIADVPINTQCFPLIAGQVGVGICQRRKQVLSSYGNFQMRYVLALPRQIDKDGKKDRKSHIAFFDKLCSKLNEKLVSDNHFLRLDKILFYDGNQGDNFEDKAIATIQEYMIEQEKKAVQQLVKENRLGDGVWLLKDGSLEYARLADKSDPFSFSKIQNNYRHVVGVSKSFNPELARLSKGRSASKMIAELKEGFRTPAFRYTTNRVEGEFSIWYLRIREGRYNWGPFDGVVKIEKILTNKDEKEHGLKTDDVDKISAWVFNERNPVCYGKDDRWANHLYPIYLTESFVKSKYLSTEHFIHLF